MIITIAITYKIITEKKITRVNVKFTSLNMHANEIYPA